MGASTRVSFVRDQHRSELPDENVSFVVNTTAYPRAVTAAMIL